MATKKKRGTTIKISGPGTAEALAALTAPRVMWRPIETAPRGRQILVAYDNGNIEFVSADDNDYDWEPYDGKHQAAIIRPTHWHAIPDHPAIHEIRRAQERAIAEAQSI